MNDASHRKTVEKRSYGFLAKLVSPGESLLQRVKHAGLWVFALRITNRSFDLARIIILARLLSPTDFGLFGIALLAMSALEDLSETGFQAALIQKKDDIKPYLNTAWTVQVIRGLVLTLIILGGAPYVATFFGQADATMFIRVLGIAVLIRSFINIGVVYFQKELEFHKQFVYMFSGTLTGFLIAIPAALILHNAWALVFGLLVANSVQMIVSYFIHPFRPKLSLNQRQFNELFGFGKWLLGSSILMFLITHGDDILVGKILGITALGFYQLAYRISNTPATEITHVISQVTFPTYSKLQDSVVKLREAYLKVLQLTTFISIPLAGLIFILAPDFTRLFLGQKWMTMVPAMMILVLAGLVRGVLATTGPIFNAVGKPEITTRWQLIRLIVLGISIYPFTIQWGISGASGAVLLSTLVSTIGFIVRVRQITYSSIEALGKRIVFPLTSGLCMVLSLVALKSWSHIIGLGEFFLFVGAGILIYLSTAHLLDRFVNYGMRHLIEESLKQNV